MELPETSIYLGYKIKGKEDIDKIKKDLTSIGNQHTRAREKLEEILSNLKGIFPNCVQIKVYIHLNDNLEWKIEAYRVFPSTLYAQKVWSLEYDGYRLIAKSFPEYRQMIKSILSTVR